MEIYLCTECGFEVEDEISLNGSEGYCWTCMKPVRLMSESEIDENDSIIKREETTR